jgi:hypothetical protein
MAGTDFRSLLERTAGREPAGQLVPLRSAFPVACRAPRWRSFLQILAKPDDMARDFGRRKWEPLLEPEAVVADLRGERRGAVLVNPAGNSIQIWAGKRISNLGGKTPSNFGG